MSPATEPPLPPPPPRPAAARRAGPWAALLVVAGWAAGMLLDYHPMLLSGLARMQSEWNDTRLQNYFLEHTWRWLVRLPSDAAFWNIPAFYPVPNTAAYDGCVSWVKLEDSLSPQNARPVPSDDEFAAVRRDVLAQLGDAITSPILRDSA